MTKLSSLVQVQVFVATSTGLLRYRIKDSIKLKASYVATVAFTRAQLVHIDGALDSFSSIGCSYLPYLTGKPAIHVLTETGCQVLRLGTLLTVYEDTSLASRQFR